MPNAKILIFIVAKVSYFDAIFDIITHYLPNGAGDENDGNLSEKIVEIVKSAFIREFGSQPILSLAPGRINIIGEHIDYSDGYVLPMAIDRYICAAAALNGTPDTFRVIAIDLGQKIEWQFDSSVEERPDWLNYILGSILEWYVPGQSMGGVDLAFSGNIPAGAGLSSSAALEASTAIVLARLWSMQINGKELALHCQKVEQKYVGVQCGIMDQYASILGRKGMAIFLDCQSVEHEYVPLHLEPYTFLLCNTGVSHSLASSQYNKRRASCELGLKNIKSKYPNIRSWRDVHVQMLDASAHLMDEETRKRCGHVVREISRVKAAVSALKSTDFIELGKLMYQSHADLSANYEVSCPELDFLVALTKEDDDIIGARMMGGGFGGCTINLIHVDKTDAFLERASEAYQLAYGVNLQSYQVRSGNGAMLVVD